MSANTSLTQRLNTELASVVGGVTRSVVRVRDGRAGAGAGTVWHADGLIVTNAHVAGSRSLEVGLWDGRSMPARVLAHDPALDLAALSVNAGGLPTIALGESTTLQPGQWVMAMGHPRGVTDAITGGVVIGLGSDLPEMGRTHREWIAVSLSLRPGHSGGPLFDAEGRLVGINTMITGPSVGMAVPVHVVKRFLSRTLGSDHLPGFL